MYNEDWNWSATKTKEDILNYLQAPYPIDKCPIFHSGHLLDSSVYSRNNRLMIDITC